MNYESMIKKYIADEIKILEKWDVGNINDAMELLKESFELGASVYIFGNGGSAATASHMQNDFNKGISEHTKNKFNFVCLNDNVPTIMAIANDIGYDEIFKFQLEGKLKNDDIVIAISGSGNSKNVINAVEYAKSKGNKIIGLTGYDGGILKGLSDISVHVPVNSMQITEDLHMVFDHLVMSVFYQTMCGINHMGTTEIVSTR